MNATSSLQFTQTLTQLLLLHRYDIVSVTLKKASHRNYEILELLSTSQFLMALLWWS